MPNKSTPSEKHSRLFMHLDILGFTQLLKTPKVVEKIFRIIDNSNAHDDAHYRVILFSDTVLIYNRLSCLSKKSKQVELMYLIEFGQDIMRRLACENIFFRGLITEGEFTVVDNLKHHKAYYGHALVETHSDEKSISGVGVFVNKKLRPYMTVFKRREFSEKYDFIYTAQNIMRLEPFEETDGNKICDTFYPIAPEILLCDGSHIRIYPEIRLLISIYKNTFHADPQVRAKYLNTLRMYELILPNLVRIIQSNKFNFKMICEIDWREAENEYKQKRKYFHTLNHGFVL
jgi:hypothetical protein